MNRFMSAVAAAVLLGTALVAAPVAAANGDNLRTIIADRTGTECASVDEGGHHRGVGVGIAFNGVSLLVSCSYDDTVTAVNPADGSQVAVHSITGASSLGALAWDNGRQALWACSDYEDVGTIDLTTNEFTFKFSSDGCFDGLAYDGSDDSIWASGDVSSHVEHYTTSGTPVSSNPINLGGECGNSGIAVGGANLYLANNGCSEIYTVAKDFSTETLFASFEARLEDLECDNLTFANGPTPKAAIWSVDAYDNILNAWEIPNGSCSFGGGGTGNPPISVQIPAIAITKSASAASVSAGGSVTYSYAVKNTSIDALLFGVAVTDDKCAPVTFTGGDADHDGNLQTTETWTYACTTSLAATTTNVATATGRWRTQTVSATASATVTVGAAPTSAVLAETSRPEITLPPTSTIAQGGGDTPTSSLAIVLLVLSGIALLAGRFASARVRARRQG